MRAVLLFLVLLLPSPAAAIADVVGLKIEAAPAQAAADDKKDADKKDAAEEADAQKVVVKVEAKKEAAAAEKPEAEKPEAEKPAEKANADQEKPAGDTKKAKPGFKAPPEKKAPAKKAGEVAPARVRVQAVVNQNQTQLQQWEQNLQPQLIAELNFARHVCEIPVEQRPKVRAAGQKSLKKAAQRLLSEQQGNRKPQTESLSQLIQHGVSEALKAALPPEEFSRYQQELAARSEQRKRAAIMSVTAKLEEALGLEPDQRKAIAESLDAKWRGEWEQWLALSRYGEQYFPEIPAEIIKPHLQETQWALWNELQRIHLGSYTGMMVQPVDDLAWWGKGNAPPVGPPDAVPSDAVEREAEAAVEQAANLGEVFLQAIGNLFKANAKNKKE